MLHEQRSPLISTPENRAPESPPPQNSTITNATSVCAIGCSSLGSDATDSINIVSRESSSLEEDAAPDVTELQIPPLTPNATIPSIQAITDAEQTSIGAPVDAYQVSPSAKGTILTTPFGKPTIPAEALGPARDPIETQTAQRFDPPISPTEENIPPVCYERGHTPEPILTMLPIHPEAVEPQVVDASETNALGPALPQNALAKGSGAVAQHAVPSNPVSDSGGHLDFRDSAAYSTAVVEPRPSGSQQELGDQSGTQNLSGDIPMLFKPHKCPEPCVGAAEPILESFDYLLPESIPNGTLRPIKPLVVTSRRPVPDSFPHLRPHAAPVNVPDVVGAKAVTPSNPTSGSFGPGRSSEYSR